MFALLDHLKIDRLKVIGLSGGGITALHMASSQPARGSMMIAISAPPAFPEQARAIQRAFSEAMLGETELRRMRRSPLTRSSFSAIAIRSIPCRWPWICDRPSRDPGCG